MLPVARLSWRTRFAWRVRRILVWTQRRSLAIALPVLLAALFVVVALHLVIILRLWSPEWSIPKRSRPS